MNFLANLWLVTITKPPSLGSSLSFFKKTYHIINNKSNEVNKNYAINDSVQEFKTRELGLLQCWRTRFLDFLGSVRCAVGCFPIDFQGKVLEWVQLYIGKHMWNVIFNVITLVLSCFMDPNESNHESNHGHRIPFFRDFSRSLLGYHVPTPCRPTISSSLPKSLPGAFSRDGVGQIHIQGLAETQTLAAGTQNLTKNHRSGQS